MILLLVYVLLIFAWTGNSIIGYGYLPEKAAIITEIVTYILLLVALSCHSTRWNYRFDLKWVFLSLLLVATASMIYNNMRFLDYIYGLRLTLRFYILYLALINIDFSEKRLKKINSLLFFLFIIQLPTSFAKFIVYGVSEHTIGTYATHGGGLTTSIPLVALGFIGGFYRFCKAKILLIIIAILFIIYGIIGAKAALLFLYPPTFVGIYYILYVKRKKFCFFRDFTAIAIIILASALTSAAILKYQERLNPERKIGGSINLEYALDYTIKYETSISNYNATGRYITTIIVFRTLIDEGIDRLLLGYGPGSLTESILSKKKTRTSNLQIIANCYGITGLTHFATEYGLLGILTIIPFFLICIYRSWRWFCVEKEPYWNAFAVGCLVFSIVQLFVFLAYNTTPLLDDTITPTFYVAMAVLFNRVFRLQDSQKDKRT